MFKLSVRLLLGTALVGNAAFAQTTSTSYVPATALAAGPGKIVAISHRGEHLHHPENTMPAFQAAIDAGADYFELDVRTTSDGKFVIMHDSTLDRTTNGTGEVHKHTFDEIRALDAGAKFSPAFANTKVPTLDEALALAYGKINVYVDTKSADPQQLVDTIVQHDMQDHVVIYGNPFFLYDVHKIRPTLRVMPEAISPDICKYLDRAMQLQVIAFDANDFKDATIDVAKQAHAQIFVDRLGNADTPEAWQKAIDQGANGIQTNLPAELAAYLREHKLATH
ncbi:glycerophosphodiester phosphodiesterase [Terriglobus saanensis]|uniref:Glycerophosphoryl diester phosphodiesterase n=1 Tax=Terriglobus saanensis (strain ATCC BAA-1853 / DSM 23119 / SP1PR4) TaxID=401053 RepID=E8UZP4_TERSS|nr:glycerophosphodiester phosphodiesterase family protein [Terriglobus saanensis]ADV84387.1 glycerophosphoryl diester phosphodiesterase [Terriglobus saanensis SP1PR4]